MLDRTKIGHQFDPHTLEVEKGQLKFFARAIGETNPVYTDEQAAQAAGYRTIPAPPTFMFSIDLNGPDPLPMLTLFNLDIARILHGSQEFQYLKQIYAGDRITQRGKILDIYHRRNGSLEFIVQESRYTNQNNELVGKALQTIVYRN